MIGFYHIDRTVLNWAVLLHIYPAHSDLTSGIDDKRFFFNLQRFIVQARPLRFETGDAFNHEIKFHNKFFMPRKIVYNRKVVFKDD